MQRVEEINDPFIILLPRHSTATMALRGKFCLIKRFFRATSSNLRGRLVLLIVALKSHIILFRPLGGTENGYPATQDSLIDRLVSHANGQCTVLRVFCWEWIICDELS